MHVLSYLWTMLQATLSNKRKRHFGLTTCLSFSVPQLGIKVQNSTTCASFLRDVKSTFGKNVQYYSRVHKRCHRHKKRRGKTVFWEKMSTLLSVLNYCTLANIVRRSWQLRKARLRDKLSMPQQSMFTLKCVFWNIYIYFNRCFIFSALYITVHIYSPATTVYIVNHSQIEFNKRTHFCSSPWQKALFVHVIHQILFMLACSSICLQECWVELYHTRLEIHGSYKILWCTKNWLGVLSKILGLFFEGKW